MSAAWWRTLGGVGLVAALALGLGFAPAAAPPQAAAEVEAAAQGPYDFVFLGEARPLLVRMHVRVDGRTVEAAWDDFMKYLFAYLDVNGDGALDKAEAERVPGVELIRNGGLSFGGGFGRGGGAPTFDALDTDKDGKVTLAELSAYYRKSGLAPFQTQTDNALANRLSRATFFGGGPEPTVEAVSAAVFALLDADGDGKLTKEELARAPAALLRVDENEDEIVTARELVPNVKAPRDPFAAMMAGPKAAGKAGGETLVAVPRPGKAPAGLVRSLQERYGPKAKKPGAKKLSRQDLGLDEATFRRLDADGDGLLDAEELARFTGRPPDLEVMVRLGSKEGLERVELAGGRSPLADELQRTGGVALLDLGMTRVELRGNSEGGPSDLFAGLVRQQILAQFKAADKDNNGYLDKKEAESNAPIFRNLFKAMDRDGDGKLYEKEVVAYLDQYTKVQAMALASCVSLGLADVSSGLFDLLDVNRDGRLSVREMRGAVGLLKRLDRGGKGYLTRADVPRSYRLTLRLGPGGGGGEAAAFAAIYGGADRYKRKEPAAAGPAWFRKMDRNRDGDVSRKEWLFSEAKFREIDADGDGLISAEEAERYDAQRRTEK